METDFIKMAQGRIIGAQGSIASRLIQNGGDPLALRPFIGKDGRQYLMKNVGGKPVAYPVVNADATLRHEEWLHIDQAIIRVAREPLRFVEDLRGRGLTYSIPNGMGSTVLLSEKQSDVNDATISMDPDREGDNDRPVYGSDYLPLPVIHKDFHFSSRQILTSRNTGAPLDTSMIEESTRKVAETAEKLALGISSFPTYGGGTIYGLTTFPSVLTKTITTPVGASNVGTTLIAEILQMRQQAYNAKHYGPFMLYNAPNWDQYIDDDFKSASDKTIRQRLAEIEGIQGVTTLPYLTNYDMILVQMTSNVVRLVIGMDMQAIQWETHGGMRVNFKVMAILVPQFRADHNSNTGIVYGSI